jgi:hypothetical protein
MSYQVLRTLLPSFGQTNSALTLKYVSSFQIFSCGIHDRQDNYRIITFEGSESLNSGAPLKSHLAIIDGANRLSDRFLRLHFNECLAVSVCRGDVMEDYEEQEIENLMEELGVYNGAIETSDPKWSTPLGSHIHAYLIRQKMAE